jgi:hypothetical protein
MCNSADTCCEEVIEIVRIHYGSAGDQRSRSRILATPLDMKCCQIADQVEDTVNALLTSLPAYGLNRSPIK